MISRACGNPAGYRISVHKRFGNRYLSAKGRKFLTTSVVC